MSLTIAEYISYYSLKLISLLIRLLPKRVSTFIGYSLGFLIHLTFPIRKNVAKLNLRIAFPEKSESEINKILKKCYIHFGFVLIDLLRIKRINHINLKDYIKIDSSSMSLLNNSNGGIIVTGHIGNWEMMFPILGLSKIPFSAVVQSQKNKGVQKFFKELREYHGNKTLLKGVAIKVLVSELENKIFLGLASDQNVGKKGYKVSFFGLDTFVPKGAALFNVKLKIPIYLLYCVIEKNKKYKLYIKKMETVKTKNGLKYDVGKICKFIVRDLETIIRKYPEQYFWFHRKWPKEIYKNNKYE